MTENRSRWYEEFPYGTMAKAWGAASIGGAYLLNLVGCDDAAVIHAVCGGALLISGVLMDGVTCVREYLTQQLDDPRDRTNPGELEEKAGE